MLYSYLGLTELRYELLIHRAVFALEYGVAQNKPDYSTFQPSLRKFA